MAEVSERTKPDQVEWLKEPAKKRLAKRPIFFD